MINRHFTITTFLLANTNALVPIDTVDWAVPDSDYIYGSIEIQFNKRAILPRHVIDLVDQLWAYIINGVPLVREGRPFSCYFPDQPIRVDIEPGKGQTTQLRIDQGKIGSALIPTQDFLETVLSSALEFFLKMRILVPSNRTTYDQYISTIRDEQKRRNSLPRG